MEKSYSRDEEDSPGANEEGSAMRFYASQEEQELTRLKENMNRTATEKFHSLMGMMKIGNLMKKAVIRYKS